MRTLQDEYVLLDSDVQAHLGVAGLTFEAFQNLDRFFAEEPARRNAPEHREHYLCVRRVVEAAYAAERRRQQS